MLPLCDLAVAKSFQLIPDLMELKSLFLCLLFFSCENILICPLRRLQNPVTGISVPEEDCHDHIYPKLRLMVIAHGLDVYVV